MYEKLKCRKLRIKEWNKESFKWINLNVNEELKILNDLVGLFVDHFVEDNEEIATDRNKFLGELWNTLNLKECMLRLKSIELWNTLNLNKSMLNLKESILRLERRR